MADCKACGAWFGTVAPGDLCPACERALKRLNGYVSPVVHCKDCKHMEISEETNGRYCHVWGFFNGAGDEGFCNYGERIMPEECFYD